ncbi:MAG: cytochrome b/b6 domain-containing protein [Elusimicrobiota bacterium]
MKPIRIAAAALTLLVMALVPVRLGAQENDECMACHSEGMMGARRVNIKAFKGSIHGEHLCVSCHSDLTDFPHPEKPKPVECKSCHRVEAQIYLDSDHGRAAARGMTEAAACKDCHGHSHTLLNSRHPKSPVNRKNIRDTCAACHGNPKRMEKAHLSIQDPLDSYAHTVHGEAFSSGKVNAAVCTDCHGSHDLHGAANSTSRIFWRRVPETCGRCHANVLAVYNKSIHGRAAKAGIKEAPVCTSCHGEHTIRAAKDPGASSYAGQVTATCTGCHASEKLNRKFGLPIDRLKTYMDTYHGLAQKRQDLHVANCASCHGFHDIMPHTDPQSSIHRSNLSQTCGKCHPGAGIQLARGYVHAPPTEQHWSIFWAKRFYLLLIPLVIGGMLLHNGLDLLRKALRLARGQETMAPHTDLRLTVNERLQHLINGAAFIILAYSGFALKYPDAWWALPLRFADEDLRRIIHRAAAVTVGLLGIYHTGYLLGTKRGRTVLFGLLPRWRDISEPFALLAHNIGWRSNPPHLATPYNYIEKSEYWALVWGTIVMMVTGTVLAFPDLTLQHLPAWAPELATMIHYYEAVLACLAIAVWHFYWVIFDPAVYPMNWAWLAGYVRLKGKKDKTKGLKA